MTKNNGSIVTETTPVAPTAKMASKDDLRKLFAAYDAAEKALTENQAKTDGLKARRSATVKAIVEAAAGKKGPFRHPTSQLVMSAVERANKNGGESSWYFKSPGEHDLIEV